MKVTELISALNKRLAESGDLEVEIESFDGGWVNFNLANYTYYNEEHDTIVIS
jgi:hypothetical protein